MLWILRHRFGFAFEGSVVIAKKPVLFLPLIVVMLSSYRSQAYYIGTTGSNLQHDLRPTRRCLKRCEPGTLGFLPSKSLKVRHCRYESGILFSATSSPSFSGDFETEITSLCDVGQYDEAFSILQQLPADASLKSNYVRLLRSLSDRQLHLQEERMNERTNIVITTKAAANDDENADSKEQYLFLADTIIKTMLELGKQSDSHDLLPTAENVHLVIKMWWSSSFVEGASVRCRFYLDTLWSLYEKRKDERFVPLYESYYCAVSACSAKDRGSDAAERAENLLEEMESFCRKHPKLTPDRSIANGVM